MDAHRRIRRSRARVLTSDGEACRDYRRVDVPAGALTGLPVSAGTVEGRARSSWAWTRPTSKRATSWSPLHGPSWTPAFVAIKGLVTEVGA